MSERDVDRARVVVSGVVQGVCFRWETRAAAERLGVAGWVRNRADGTVEGCFEGARDAVEALLEWCRRGPPSARVSKVDIDWSKIETAADSFEIRH